MVDDVVTEARRRLDAIRPSSADDIRRAPGQVLTFSPAMAVADSGIKAVLARAVYRNDAVMSVMAEADTMVRRLFRRYLSDSGTMPPDWRPAPGDDAVAMARRVCDFLAGMTDRYAAAEYARVFPDEASRR
jgi:dGTPase